MGDPTFQMLEQAFSGPLPDGFLLLEDHDAAHIATSDTRSCRKSVLARLKYAEQDLQLALVCLDTIQYEFMDASRLDLVAYPLHHLA